MLHPLLVASYQMQCTVQTRRLAYLDSEDHVRRLPAAALAVPSVGVNQKE
jgi:hypothetical protein